MSWIAPLPVVDGPREVVAVSVPPGADWRWRIVGDGGAVEEESSRTFDTVDEAFAQGRVRLHQIADGRGNADPASDDRP
jgi:hypothetical protein